jgi:hypothetical protein
MVMGRNDMLGTSGTGLASASARVAAIVALADRARHDRAFRASLRHDAVATAARFGLTLRDSEWAGLRDLLNE